MTEPFDDFMNDVEQNMRQEYLENLWKRYGRLVIGACVSVVVLGGAWFAYSNKKEQWSVVASEKYVKALGFIDAGDIERGIKVLATMDESHPTYAALSVLVRAGHLSQKGGKDFDQAQALLLKLGQEKKTPSLISEFAVLAYCRNEIDRFNVLDPFAFTPKEVDRQNLNNLLSRLKPLSEKQSTWRLSALELMALAHTLLGQYPQALELLASIQQDKMAPSGTHTRADVLSSFILQKIKP